MRTAIYLCVALSIVASMSVAQEIPQLPKPQKEHDWLQKFVGEWDTESEAMTGPGQPAMKCKGKIKSRSLGGFWVVSDMKSEMPGMQMNAVLTLGFDTQKKKYVGSWIDSMTSYLWNYEGTVDATGKILTLEASGPNFMADGKLAKFRDIYEFKSNDEIAITSAMHDETAGWVTFMTGKAKRTK